MHTLQSDNILALLELSEERYLIIHHAQECFFLQRILMIKKRLYCIFVRLLACIASPLRIKVYAGLRTFADKVLI